MVKSKEDPPGNNIIPVSDGRRNRLNLPLIVIDYEVGQALIEAVNKREEVLLSVDFDAVDYHHLVLADRQAKSQLLDVSRQQRGLPRSASLETPNGDV